MPRTTELEDKKACEQEKKHATPAKIAMADTARLDWRPRCIAVQLTTALHQTRLLSFYLSALTLLQPVPPLSDCNKQGSARTVMQLETTIGAYASAGHLEPPGRSKNCGPLVLYNCIVQLYCRVDLRTKRCNSTSATTAAFNNTSVTATVSRGSRGFSIPL